MAGRRVDSNSMFAYVCVPKPDVEIGTKSINNVYKANVEIAEIENQFLHLCGCRNNHVCENESDEYIQNLLRNSIASRKPEFDVCVYMCKSSVEEYRQKTKPIRNLRLDFRKANKVRIQCLHMCVREKPWRSSTETIKMYSKSVFGWQGVENIRIRCLRMCACENPMPKYWRRANLTNIDTTCSWMAKRRTNSNSMFAYVWVQKTNGEISARNTIHKYIYNLFLDGRAAGELEFDVCICVQKAHNLYPWKKWSIYTKPVLKWQGVRCTRARCLCVGAEISWRSEKRETNQPI